MQLDESIGDRQAQAGAFAPARAATVDLAKRCKGNANLFLVHADAGVAHTDLGTAIRKRTRFDDNGATRSREPDGIPDQVVECLLQSVRVTADRGKPIPLPIFEIETGGLGYGAIGGDASSQDLIQAYFACIQRVLPTLNLGNIKNVV